MIASIAKAAIIIWFALSALYVIITIGKPRPLINPGTAALMVLIDGLLIVIIATCWDTP